MSWFSDATNINIGGDDSSSSMLAFGPLAPLAYLAHQGVFGQGPQSFFKNAGNAISSNVNNVVGEIDGSNAARQDAWNKQVAQNAKDAQTKLIQDQITAAKNSDLTASNAAGANRMTGIPGSPGGPSGSYNYATPTKSDITDFLGL